MRSVGRTTALFSTPECVGVRGGRSFWLLGCAISDTSRKLLIMWIPLYSLHEQDTLETLFGASVSALRLVLVANIGVSTAIILYVLIRGPEIANFLPNIDFVARCFFAANLPITLAYIVGYFTQSALRRTSEAGEYGSSVGSRLWLYTMAGLITAGFLAIAIGAWAGVEDVYRASEALSTKPEHR